MEFIDTHVHVNFPTFEDDLDAVRQRWLEAGVGALVHSCVTPDEFDRTAAIAARYPEVFFAVGLHPLEVEQGWGPDLPERVRALAQGNPKVVAIGETGLDWYKSTARSRQTDAFLAQLRIAADLDLPVIIHCRDAARDAADLLRTFLAEGRRDRLRGVMHCWGGSPEETHWFLDLGLHISFSGTVTFKNAEAIHASALVVPRDRLLIETDCPFLAPVPRRGKRNEPAYVTHVAERLAHLQGTTVAAIAAQTTQNARDLFRLPPTATHPRAIAPAARGEPLTAPRG